MVWYRRVFSGRHTTSHLSQLSLLNLPRLEKCTIPSVVMIRGLEVHVKAGMAYSICGCAIIVNVHHDHTQVPNRECQ